jgi:hypothetical protein
MSLYVRMRVCICVCVGVFLFVFVLCVVCVFGFVFVLFASFYCVLVLWVPSLKISTTVAKSRSGNFNIIYFQILF